jgi:calcineurin-like phosphoesterase family protein
MRWFTSDQHFGHPYVADLRGFTTTQEHDAEIERRWNSVVHPDDTVFAAGDVALGNRRETLKIYERLHGTKILIPGNHDSVWAGHRNAWRHEALYRQYFSIIQSWVKLNIGPHTVHISHFPYKADSRDQPRFMAYRLQDIRSGSWLLHGHTHSLMRRTSPREIHIGLDAWDLYPVRESSILEVIQLQLMKEERERPESEIPVVSGAREAARDR